MCCCGSKEFGVESDGANYPAPFAFNLGGKKMCSSSFSELNLEGKTPNPAKNKILVICSGENRLRMANGAIFSTGHNPTEFAIPIHHLIKAGYEIVICSPEAKPITVEKWAMGACDLGGYGNEVKATLEKLQDKLDRPLDAKSIPTSLDGYAGVFVPGGHGPMVNMHEKVEVGALLRSAHAQGLPTATLCHGPNCLRATVAGGSTEPFPYKDYKICVFPDKADEVMWFRYLPGMMIEKCEAELRKLGCQVQNKEMDDSCVQDRELITGASQAAAQKVGQAFVHACLGIHATSAGTVGNAKDGGASTEYKKF
jgi:molecular chaperone Hsp31 and glyoxalase 3